MFGRNKTTYVKKEPPLTDTTEDTLAPMPDATPKRGKLRLYIPLLALILALAGFVPIEPLALLCIAAFLFAIIGIALRGYGLSILAMLIAGVCFATSPTVGDMFGTDFQKDMAQTLDETVIAEVKSLLGEEPTAMKALPPRTVVHNVSENAELHVVYIPTSAEIENAGEGGLPYMIDVNIDKPQKEITLLLSSQQPLYWQVLNAGNTLIKEIIVTGNADSQVIGDVEVEKVNYFPCEGVSANGFILPCEVATMPVPPEKMIAFMEQLYNRTGITNRSLNFGDNFPQVAEFSIQ